MREKKLINVSATTAKGVILVQVLHTIFLGEYIDIIFNIKFTLSTYNPQLNKTSTTLWGLKK